MRAVLDPNVLISALLAPGGAPALALDAWRAGRYELIASPQLIDELRRALDYPKLRRRIPPDAARAAVVLIERDATIADDPPSPPARSADPGDDDLIALARSRRAMLVSGDRDLLDLGGVLPILAPAPFLRWLEDPQSPTPR